MKIKCLSIIAALALGACTTSANGGSTGGGSSVTLDDLNGTKWTITSIDGAPPVSEKAKAEFQDGRIGISAGCNGIGGRFTLEGDRISGGPYISTQMFCDGLMEQERALSQLLEEKPQATLAGDSLTLKSANHSAELKKSS